MTMRTEHEDERSRLQLPSLKLVLLLIVVVIAAIFFFQNGHDADVEFLGWSGTWPVRVIIVVSIVLGAIIDRLGSWFWRRARSRKNVG